MANINQTIDFKSALVSFCQADATFRASDEISELRSLVDDLPEPTTATFKDFYKKEAAKIIENEKYRTAKRNVADLPIDLAFEGINTPAGIAAFESNHNAFFWRLVDESEYFGLWVFFEQKRQVLEWIKHEIAGLSTLDSLPKPEQPTRMEPPTPDSLPEPERKAIAPAKVTARQLALFIYYRIAAGENGLLPNGERVATWQKLGNEYSLTPKNIEMAYGKISNTKTGKDEREKTKTPHNPNDHKAIIPMLNDYPAAQRLAQSTLKTIENKT